MRLPFRISIWATISLVLASLTLSAPTDPEVPLKQLTQSDFTSSVASGLWLVEFFSPYCIHCKMFKPTWEKLVDAKSTSALSFSMAQVDCIANGDLCQEQSIGYYPMIRLYLNGELLETYNGDRSLNDLSTYVDDNITKHLPSVDALPIPLTGTSEETEVAQEQLGARAINTAGEVNVINGIAEFDAALTEGPLFVKMYAPWCGHCKKLAPIWRQLASSMKGVLNVAEVDCEANGELCKRETVEGYPMLFFYQNGHRLDYRGPRKLADLESYARRTSAAAAGLQPLDVSKLDELIAAEAAFFIYLHDPSSSYEKGATTVLRKTATQHAGGAPIYHTSSRLLYDEFSIGNNEPVLISIKDHARTAAAYFFLTSSLQDDPKRLDRFLMIHRFPSAFELTSTNFQEVMRGSTSDLVVIAPLIKSSIPGEKEATQILTQTNKDWADKLTTPNAATLHATFVWMDIDRWDDWLKNTYGFKWSPDASPRVILADHKRLLYYDGEKNAPIRLVQHEITAALEAYGKGTITMKHSESWIARKIRGVHDSIESVAETLAHHFILAILGLVFGLAALFVFMDRWMNADVQALRSGSNNERLRRNGSEYREKRPLTSKSRRLD